VAFFDWGKGNFLMIHLKVLLYCSSQYHSFGGHFGGAFWALELPDLVGAVQRLRNHSIHLNQIETACWSAIMVVGPSWRGAA